MCAAAWESRWVKSSFKGSDEGAWGWTAGKNYGDPDNKGMQTTTDYRWYDISTKTEDFNNKGKTLVLQYTVKHEQTLDCGGGYIKLAPKGVDQSKFGGDSEYSIMFGPDICGYSTKKVHVIFTYKGKNHLIKREIKPETDEKTHIYTLILKPDNTYEVQIDLKSVQTGSLYDDWDMLEPKIIKDPKASKPADWDEREEIDDPEDKKPDGYDDIPKQIVDPDATKPDDWDDDSDGAFPFAPPRPSDLKPGTMIRLFKTTSTCLECTPTRAEARINSQQAPDAILCAGEWEAPMIDNPEFKGEWKAKRIKNDAYKGKWVAPDIANPKFEDDKELYNVVKSNSLVGFELWQVRSSLPSSLRSAKEAWQRNKSGVSLLSLCHPC